MIEKMTGSKSGLFLVALLVFIAGIAVASWLAFSEGLLKWLAVGLAAGLVSLIMVWKKPLARLLLLGGAFFVFGLIWFGFSEVRRFEPVSALVGQTVGLEGVVISLPAAQGNRAQYLVSAERRWEEGGWRPFSPRILLSANRYPEFAYGDRLNFSCQLWQDDADRIASRGAAARCWSPNEVSVVGHGQGDPLMAQFFRLRAMFLDLIADRLPEPQAGLLAGLLVGERAGLGDDLVKAFRRTGTMHMVAISGFNVSLITFALFGWSGRYLGRKRAFWTTLFLLVGFVGLVGAGASVVRAALMGAVVLVGKYFGRTGSALRLLALAASLMLLVNPWLLRHDLGFDLSFLATLGLVVLAEPMAHLLPLVPEGFNLRRILAETSAATLATLPLTLTVFGSVSLIAPLANLAILLLVPWAMGIGTLAMLLSAWPILGPALGWISWIILSAIIGFAEFLAGVPFAAVSIPYGSWISVIPLFIIGTLVWYWRKICVEVSNQKLST
ncbi:ComEC/Rec2 family competence protein [Candidatus Uhrbacteria bacterium]|nr:ComEC/Rec2 family competence protein [Candidatus Uhrbacteria bacterium]